MAKKRRSVEVDDLRVDAIRYDESWKTPGFLSALRPNTVNRIRFALPLGWDFSIFFVSGFAADGTPQLWLTLSGNVRDALVAELSAPFIYEVRNSALWRSLRAQSE